MPTPSKWCGGDEGKIFWDIKLVIRSEKKCVKHDQTSNAIGLMEEMRDASSSWTTTAIAKCEGGIEGNGGFIFRKFFSKINLREKGCNLCKYVHPKDGMCSCRD